MLVTRRRFFCGSAAVGLTGTALALPTGLLLPARPRVSQDAQLRQVWVGLLNEGREVLERKPVAVKVERTALTVGTWGGVRVTAAQPSVCWPVVTVPRIDSWAVWSDWPILGGERPMGIMRFPEGPFSVVAGTLTLTLDKWYLQIG